jgi:hypothetical protein
MRLHKVELGLSNREPKGPRDRNLCSLQTTVVSDSHCMAHSKGSKAQRRSHQKSRRVFIQIPPGPLLPLRISKSREVFRSCRMLCLPPLAARLCRQVLEPLHHSQCKR